MVPRRTLQECLALLGEIETSIAAVELALTRLEFALVRLPADGKLVGRSKLLETAEAYRACLVVLSEQHQLMLVDIERKRSAPPPTVPLEMAENATVASGCYPGVGAFASLVRPIELSPASHRGRIYQVLLHRRGCPPRRSITLRFDGLPYIRSR